MVEAMGRSTPCHHKKSDGIRTEKIDFVLTQICDIVGNPVVIRHTCSTAWPALFAALQKTGHDPASTACGCVPYPLPAGAESKRVKKSLTGVVVSLRTCQSRKNDP